MELEVHRAQVLAQSASTRKAAQQIGGILVPRYLHGSSARPSKNFLSPQLPHTKVLHGAGAFSFQDPHADA